MEGDGKRREAMEGDGGRCKAMERCEAMAGDARRRKAHLVGHGAEARRLAATRRRLLRQVIVRRGAARVVEHLVRVNPLVSTPPPACSLVTTPRWRPW